MGAFGGNAGSTTPLKGLEKRLIAGQTEAIERAGGLLDITEPEMLRLIQEGRAPDEIESLFRERLLGSLRGEEADPALERALAESRRGTEAQFSRRLGPGFARSSAGARGLSELGTQEALARFGAGQQQVKDFSSLLAGRTGLLSDLRSRRLGELQGVGAGRLGLIPGFGQALQPVQFKKQLAAQQEASKKAAEAQEEAGKFGALGTVVGVGGGLLLSSEKFKKDIKELDENTQDEIAEDFLKTPMHTWKYKHEDKEDKPHLGFITEKTTDSITNTEGDAIDISSTLGAITMTLKKLSRDIVALKENNGGLAHGTR